METQLPNESISQKNSYSAAATKRLMTIDDFSQQGNR